VLVRNLMLSCDPTQRTWIAGDTYLPAVKIGEVVRSFGAGRIEASNNPGFKVGDMVLGLVGWQDYVAMKADGELNTLPRETPLELAMLNETSRFNLVIDVIDRVPRLRATAAHLKEDMKNAILDNLAYAHEHGRDREEITNLVWPY